MDWLNYKIQGETIEVTLNIWRLFEVLPEFEDVDTWCLDLYPIIDEIQSTRLRQIVKTDASGVDVTLMKPLVLLKIIHNLFQYTRAEIRLVGFQAHGVDPFLKALVDSVKPLLPSFLRKMIVLES